MRRIALFTSLFLGLTTLVAVPAVITATPAVALECTGGWVPNSSQTSCIAPVVSAEAPAAPMVPICNPPAYYEASSNSCKTPAAPVLIPVCNAPSYYEASSNSCKSPAAPAPMVPICNAPSFYEASSNSCKTPGEPALIPICNAPSFYEASSNSCKSPTGAAVGGNNGGSTGNGSSGSGSGLSCSNGQVPNPSYTSCIAPVVDGTGPASGTSGGSTACPALTAWNGQSCEPTMPGSSQGSGGNNSAGNGSLGNNSGASGGGTSVQPGADPCLFSTDRANCEARKSTAVSACSPGFFYDQGIQGCKAVTAQSATIACADGTFKVTAIECGTFGGAIGSAVASSTGSTCTTGFAPNQYGACVPIGSLTGNNSNSSCGALTVWDGTKCAPTIGAGAGAGAGAGGGTNSTTADPKQACAARGWTYTAAGSCIAPLVATAAGASLGGSCLQGYVVIDDGSCKPINSTDRNTGPISTGLDPCRIQPYPASCFASGAVIPNANSVIQAQTTRYGPTPPTPSSGGGSGTPQGGDEGRLSSQFAAPAKPGRAAAPVLIFNVLGSDNKALKDSTGKELTTRPAVKSGNTVFVDSSGAPINTVPTLGPDGRPVTGPDGSVLYTRLMTFAGQEAVTDSAGRGVTAAPLLNGSGRPLLASNGGVVYAPPMLDLRGNIILNAYGSPVLSLPLSDSTGAIAVGPNGEPVVVQPMLADGGLRLLNNGNPVYVGAAGTAARTSKNEPIMTAFGQKITFEFSGSVADEGGNAVLGPDGRPVILSATGTPLRQNGSPLLDARGKPIRVTSSGGVTDSSGRPILGADKKQIKLGAALVATVLKSGNNVIKSLDGKTVTVGLNGQLVDTSGNPVLSLSGKAIYIDAETKTFKDAAGKIVTVSKTGVTSAKSSPLTFQTGAIDAA